GRGVRGAPGGARQPTGHGVGGDQVAHAGQGGGAGQELGEPGGRPAWGGQHDTAPRLAQQGVGRCARAARVGPLLSLVASAFALAKLEGAVLGRAPKGGWSGKEGSG